MLIHGAMDSMALFPYAQLRFHQQPLRVIQTPGHYFTLIQSHRPKLHDSLASPMNTQLVTEQFAMPSRPINASKKNNFPYELVFIMNLSINNHPSGLVSSYSISIYKMKVMAPRNSNVLSVTNIERYNIVLLLDLPVINI